MTFVVVLAPGVVHATWTSSRVSMAVVYGETDACEVAVTVGENFVKIVGEEGKLHTVVDEALPSWA